MGTADAYPNRTLPAPLRFAIALAAVAMVFAIDRAAGAAMDDGSQFLSLGIAVMASAWFAGTGPALAATVLGAVLGASEVGSTSTEHVAESTHLALFVVQGVLLTALVAELRGARRAAEQEAQVAEAARREGDTANRMKDEFLATVSHELRTPLNPVLGWVHLLRTGKLDKPTATRGLEAIERNVRLQAQLTMDLLDVSKALTGKLQVESAPTHLTDALRQAIAAAAPAAKAKGVHLDASLPDRPVVVLGDAARLRQIAWHLVANAIKFTPRDGTVKVSAESTGHDALLIVRDSGTGIDPAFLPRIFDRFTQEDSSTTRTAGGMGVGLALVRGLVELQGGEIQASNSEGGGAVFTVRFPLQPAELAGRPAAHIDIAPASSPPLDGLRVLVLDRDREGRELVRTVLQQRGASVRAVDSVGDALESLEAWHPDVLVSDIGTPEHDSYEIVGKIQTLDAAQGGRIPAIALTSVARSDARLRQMLASVQRQLPKPLEPARLTAEIARLTGRERRRAQR
jgi:signal transduction histidine kinase